MREMMGALVLVAVLIVILVADIYNSKRRSKQ